MAILFALAVIVGFVLWFLSALPGTRVPEWSARLSFLIAAVLWFVPVVSSAS
jgi:hypothetical protein